MLILLDVPSDSTMPHLSQTVVMVDVADVVVDVAAAVEASVIVEDVEVDVAVTVEDSAIVEDVAVAEEHRPTVVASVTSRERSRPFKV